MQIVWPAVILLASVTAGGAVCQGDECAIESDSEALLQVRADELETRPRSQQHQQKQQHQKPQRPHKRKQLILGSPLAGFHNATFWVYIIAARELLARLNDDTEIVTIWQYPHPILFPMFTGVGGNDIDHESGQVWCKEYGCADKCLEAGLGHKTPCVDWTVDSNLPHNHNSWLGNSTQIATYQVHGTAMEDIAIGLYAPKYTGWKSIFDMAKDPKASKKILGFKGSHVTCGVNYCPACLGGNLDFITKPPLSNGTNFLYDPDNCTVFQKRIRRELDQKVRFGALMYKPNMFLAQFGEELVSLDVSPWINAANPNQGKAQYNKASLHKFRPELLALLGGIFIGTNDVQLMDGWSQGIGNDPPGLLPGCTNPTFTNACSYQAAEKWIKLHSNNGIYKMGVYETFFW